MDALLARLGSHAVNYAIRSGIALTSTYAIGQCSRLLKTVDDRGVRNELRLLQDQLNTKIKILTPVIDLIEFKSGRGNVFLESAVPLAKSLHREVVGLGKRLENAASAEEHAHEHSTTVTTKEAHHAELLAIIRAIKSLLRRIERDIPTLQLAITASGETFTSALPSGISPSRFLQASFFLNLGDTQFARDPTRTVQIGPPFYLSLYMLFVGHSNPPPQQATSGPREPATPNASRGATPMKDQPYGFEEGDRRPIWQEVVHKARVTLCRTPLGWHFDHLLGYVSDSPSSPGLDFAGRPDEYSYHLEIIEDLEDGRVHEEDSSTPYDTVLRAGIRESIPIHEVAKIFYTDSGRVLNIGNADEAGNRPVLLLKRDVASPTAAEVARRIMKPGTQQTPLISDDNESLSSDHQDDIDRQLREESGFLETEDDAPVAPVSKEQSQPHPLALHLPPHLNPEWLALEVYTEDDEGASSDSEDEDQGDDAEGESSVKAAVKQARPSLPQQSSMDAKLLAQMKNLSTTDVIGHGRSGQVERPQTQRDDNFMARSPFGSVTSSLSLMEMLIRLTSLQEFQQAAHLSIPDYILSFFLEETSTTGLHGEERWKARNEAKRRVGFDPYTDTPTK
ncbi:RanGTP-binding protein [Coniella lustricola]|uniref:RanGTP-binding protein n=1 Tax=Coniella lustricola TaxID=2025994 RepID=A0A2T3AM62_9PEZI|nr:RanGTP-binding protein [Coniella lustricola]